jgi:DNA-binding IclR family transcriptional regulator
VARNGDRCFVFGHRLLWWESCYRKNLEVPKVIQPLLDRIRDATLETAIFSILVRDRTVHVADAVSPHVTSTRFSLGAEAPLNAGASGKIVLAYLDESDRQKFFKSRLKRLTPDTITDVKRLQKDLQECRARGFALSTGERFPNTSSVAAPVCDHYGKVIGAISVLGPSERMTAPHCRNVGRLLLKIIGESAIAVRKAQSLTQLLRDATYESKLRRRKLAAF